ncbi:hypothetical protein CSB09_02800 [Candidatus Gracilibacteria bacterium]|nr:MAG: hypothetical protein CSB09_02800 [Candidatus Gracilibacteria bacterium]
MTILSISDIQSIQQSQNKKLSVAGIESPVDIQTIENTTLEKILQTNDSKREMIPHASEIISKHHQSKYYQSNKIRLREQLLQKKFAILDGPTGTGKTTLAKTFAYEASIPLYELGGDSEKSVEDFIKEIKTYRKNNLLQIREIPGLLHRAIVNGHIILINEANSLSPDIQLALTNMSEGGCIVVGTKKIKIHPNFALIFTSNSGYAGTQEYNNAVIRKAGGTITIGYEPTLDGEFQVVKTLYQKIQKNFESTVNIDDKDLKIITKAVRKVRTLICEHNRNQRFDERLLTQDLNNFGDFFYIRFYEHLFKNIIGKTISSCNLQKEFEKISLPLLQENICGIVQAEYITHHNDIHTFYTILTQALPGERIHIDREDIKVLHPVVYDMMHNAIDSEENDLGSEFSKEGDTDCQLNVQKAVFNPNIFRQQSRNEVQSQGKELERIENFYDFIEDIHSRIVDSRRKKVIHNIQTQKLGSGERVLCVDIDNTTLYFSSEHPEDLENIETIQDVKTKVFGNKSLKILIPKNQTNTQIQSLEKQDCIEYDNVFERPKSLEIRRFSKIIQREVDKKPIISVLGFTGEIRDIRYEDDDGTLYIPNAKVNDVILNNYYAMGSEHPIFKEAKSKKHFLILENGNTLRFFTKKTLQQKLRTGNKHDIIILLAITDRKENEILDDEIKKKLSQIDTLGLHNGGKETSHTATPENIYGGAKPISSRVYDILGPKFGQEKEVSPTTQNTLEEMEQQLLMGNDILLTGPSGVGKTSYTVEVAQKLGLPYISFQIDSNVSEKTFSSHVQFNESEIENTITPFLDYYINGGIVELKELNMSPELTFLNNFLDTTGSITINGNTYRRNPNFHIVATVNPFDNRLFSGTNPLNTALLGRFTNIHIDYIQDIGEERDIILAFAKIHNPTLIQNLGEVLQLYVYEILEKIVFPIRKKVNELKKSQHLGTDEELKILAEKIMTLDIFKKILLSSRSADELMLKIKQFFSLSQEEKTLLGEESQQIFRVFE